jgi:hypothetical protein
MPAWEYYEQAGFAICRPNLLFNCFLISCTYNLVYTMYVSHIKRVLWYTQGYIPDISPRGCGGLAESRTGFNKIYQSPKLIYSWAISEYYCALFGYIDTLPLELFASWATLPLGLLCLLGYFASWATLPLGLASWATLPLGLASWAFYWHFASWAMSHWHCLLWQCRYTVMPLGLCQHWALVSMRNDKLC